MYSYASHISSIWVRTVTFEGVLPELRSLRMLRNFRLSTPKVISGTDDTNTKKKMREKAGHAQNLLPVRTTSRQGLFWSRDFVTSGQKALLGRILRNFRLHMRAPKGIPFGVT
jgi:hypothetical protein